MRLNGRTHGPWCGARTYPTECPHCGAEVFYFSCACGCKVFFDELGGDWPIHDCRPKRTYTVERPVVRRSTPVRASRVPSPPIPSTSARIEGTVDPWERQLAAPPSKKGVTGWLLAMLFPSRNLGTIGRAIPDIVDVKPNVDSLVSRGTVHELRVLATDSPERTPPDVAEVLSRMDKPYGYIEIYRYDARNNRILRYHCLSPVRLLGDSGVRRGDVVHLSCASRRFAGETRMWVCQTLWKKTPTTWEDQ